MYGLDQIGSTLGDFIDAALHPSVKNLPAGFLILVFVVLMIAAHARGRATEGAIGQPGGGRADRQSFPDLAGDLSDPALIEQQLRSTLLPGRTSGGRFPNATAAETALNSVDGPAARPRPTQRTPSLRRMASLFGEGSGVPVKLALSVAMSPQAE